MIAILGGEGIDPFTAVSFFEFRIQGCTVKTVEANPVGWAICFADCPTLIAVRHMPYRTKYLPGKTGCTLKFSSARKYLFIKEFGEETKLL